MLCPLPGREISSNEMQRSIPVLGDTAGIKCSRSARWDEPMGLSPGSPQLKDAVGLSRMCRFGDVEANT
jgi:hypothetical protein